MRPASEEEVNNWDELVAHNPDGGNVLQLREFGAVKERQGWRAQHFMLGDTAILALTRNIMGLGQFMYIPRGPGLASPVEFREFVHSFEKSGVNGTAPFLVKIDPEIDLKLVTPTQFARIGFVPGRDIQLNNTTIVVDLRPKMDDIIASFKQKTRYNIRLAERHGVVVEAVATDKKSITTMYGLAQTTYERAGVYARSKDYFADFWLRHADAGHGQMFFATYEDKVLAGAFVTYVGEKGLYKDGGSIRENTDVQAPYALQWGIMKWLKEREVASYDLHGVPPKPRLNDASHPLAGLSRFKVGFNREVTEYVGTYDLPLNTAKYKVWLRGGERLAMAYELRHNNRLFY